MAETTLAATLKTFQVVRGDEADGSWATRVAWKLLGRDVDPALVEESLAASLELVRQSGESAEELFGPADQHADELYEQWVSEGRLVLADDDVLTWREAFVWGVAMSAALAVVFAFVLWLRDDVVTATTAVTLVPIVLVMGLGSTLASAAWDRRHRTSLLPGASDRTEEDRWSALLTDILRRRYAISGPRAHDIVVEARAHAEESGRTLGEEFGTPEEYARGFAPDLARRTGLVALALALLALAALALVLFSFSWSSVGVATIVTCQAAAQLRKYLALRTRTD